MTHGCSCTRSTGAKVPNRTALARWRDSAQVLNQRGTGPTNAELLARKPVKSAVVLQGDGLENCTA